MGWSAYGFEAVASFAPEYHDPEKDTARALRASAAFSVVVYALLPLGVGGTLGTKAIADDPTFIAFYKDAFDVIVGNTLGTVMILCLIAGLLLSMNTRFTTTRPPAIGTQTGESFIGLGQFGRSLRSSRKPLSAKT